MGDRTRTHLVYGMALQPAEPPFLVGVLQTVAGICVGERSSDYLAWFTAERGNAAVWRKVLRFVSHLDDSGL